MCCWVRQLSKCQQRKFYSFTQYIQRILLHWISTFICFLLTRQVNLLRTCAWRLLANKFKLPTAQVLTSCNLGQLQFFRHLAETSSFNIALKPLFHHMSVLSTIILNHNASSWKMLSRTRCLANTRQTPKRAFFFFFFQRFAPGDRNLPLSSFPFYSAVKPV